MHALAARRAAPRRAPPRTQPVCLLRRRSRRLLLVGSEVSFLAMSHDLYCALRDPFVDYKKNKVKYMAAIAVVSTTMAAVLVGLNCEGARSS